MVHRYWPVSKIYRTAGQTSTAFCTVLTPLPPTIEDIYDLKRLKKKKKDTWQSKTSTSFVGNF